MKSKITRCERREEASVTTFALAVTRVFIYSAADGGGDGGEFAGGGIAFGVGGFVIGVHTAVRARVHVCVCIYAARCQ